MNFQFDDYLHPESNIVNLNHRNTSTEDYDDTDAVLMTNNMEKSNDVS